jgi:hypothetical protein
MARGYPDWLAKQLEIWSKAEWSIIKGEYKTFRAGTDVPAGTTKSVSVYTVPSGKSLFITDASFMRKDNIGTILFLMFKIIGIYSYDIAATAAQQGGSLHFRQPAFVDEGYTLYASFKNIEATDSYMYTVINAYEITK